MVPGTSGLYYGVGLTGLMMSDDRFSDAFHALALP